MEKISPQASHSNPTVTPQLPNSSTTVPQQVEKLLLAIGEQTLSAKAIMNIIGLKDKSNLLGLYLHPAIKENWIEPLYPDNPKHPKQKYRLSDKGKALLKKLSSSTPN